MPEMTWQAISLYGSVSLCMPPCRMVEPIFAELDVERANKKPTAG